MSNTFGNIGGVSAGLTNTQALQSAGQGAQGQNNPQLAGVNIVGVSPGDGPQKDAQALQRVSQGVFATGGGSGGYGAAGMTTGASGYGAAGMTAGAAGYGAAGMTTGAAGYGAAGMTTGAAGYGAAGMSTGAAGYGAAGYGAAGYGAAGMSAGAGGGQNNPQLAGTNIVGVNPGNGPVQDAQAMQRVSQGQPLS